MKASHALLVVLLGASLAAAEAPAVATKEVGHLLSFLSGAGCEFYRNGTWHEAGAARAHLQKKYDYLVRKDMVRTAEDFIRLGGTESSFTREPYKVRCGEKVQASEAWLRAELLRYRSAEPKQPN